MYVCMYAHTYIFFIDKQNRIKIEWTHARTATTQTESKKVAVYDNTTKEAFLRTLAENKEILIDFPYLQNDNEATTPCWIFKQFLKGSEKNSCSWAVAGINGDVIDTNASLKDVKEATTSAILGLDAHNNQIEYLKSTKKPKMLSVDEWIWCVQNINLHLVNIANDTRLLADREIIKNYFKLT